VCFGGKSKCSDDQDSCVQVVDSYDQSNIHMSQLSGEGRQASHLLDAGGRLSHRAARGNGWWMTVCAMEDSGSLGVKRYAAAQDGEQANWFAGPGEPEPVESDVKGGQVRRTRNFGGPRS
jgi:hypothetical protein